MRHSLRLVLLILSPAHALDLPAQTSNGGVAPAQASPTTTAAPAFIPELLRRQSNDATSLCGYVAGNGSNPLTCGSGAFCGFNSVYSAFGCCTGTQGVSLVGCNLVTTCFDSAAFQGCGDSCQANTLDAWCTSKAYPYCRKYTTGIYSGFDCWSEQSQVDPVLPTPIKGYSTLDFSSTGSNGRTSSDSALSSSVSGQQPGGNGISALQTGGNIVATPFSESQRSGSTSPTAATTSTQSSSDADRAAMFKWWLQAVPLLGLACLM